MNSIDIDHQHSYSKEEAWERAELMLEELAQNYGLEIEHDGESLISFSGSGIKGTVTIDHDKINISAILGFLMVAMKPVISSEIKRKLEQKFS